MRPIILITAVSVLAALEFPTRSSAAELIPPGERIAGVSQADWSVKWWQWAFSFNRAESPVSDQTGERCHWQQKGGVWFLAGTYGTKRTERACTVPAGKILFFPLINYVVYPPSGSPEECTRMKQSAAEYTDNPSALVLEIDGQRFPNLQPHRLVSKGCFALFSNSPKNAASNGYYVAIRPLTRGTHVINFGGILQTSTQAVTYTLIVE